MPPDESPIHPLRRKLRSLPATRRFLLRALRPIMPQVGNLVRWLEAPPYVRWFDLWQQSRPRDDAAIRARLGQALPDEPQPRVLVILSPQRGRAASLVSLTQQVGVEAEIIASPEALSRQAAPGRLLLHVQAGDRLVRHGLAEFVLAARGATRGASRPLVIFADEDTGVGRFRPALPWLKTAFDPDLLLQQAALGRAVAYDTGLLARHGLLGLHGHALMLAATRAALAEAGSQAVQHIPSILLHRKPTRQPAWREETDRAAIQQALAGSGVELLPAHQGYPGVPRLRWPIPASPPLVTIIIPTRDGTALMEACLEGLLHRTDYPALEILVCDNDSQDPRLLARFAEWRRDPQFRVLPCPGPFNYSAINNHAAREAKGEILLLLNNDTEIRHPGWLREMVSHAIRPEIGAVGARLLFPNGRLQHAGTVLGLGGTAGHDMLHSPGRSPGPHDLLHVTRRVSAVTAACLAVRREAFLAVGGFDETGLRVAYNDVDLCLRLRASGLQNLVTPHAELTHKESATRGDDMSPAHRARWEEERATMRARWGEALFTDPYYSPCLALDPPARVLISPPRRLAPWREAEAPPLSPEATT